MPDLIPTAARTFAGIAHRIERARVLDPVTKRVDAVVRRLLPPGPVKDVLSGTPIGHPLHPALVAVPIGAFVGASVLDLTGERDAARRLVGLGLLSALPTAAAGASDWSDTLGPEKRVGLAHAAANYAALGLYAASWLARRRGQHGRGVVLALAGGSALAAGGWLGGHLSYALGVGVDTTAFQAGPCGWSPVAPAEDLDRGKPLQGFVEGVAVMVVRQDGQLRALADRCTHRGGPLSEGRLLDGCIECPWHGSRFRLDEGSIERGPATQGQPVYQVRLHDGWVQVRRDEERTLRTNPVGS